ncbi:DinB family protein [Bacillus xiapuensis]|uniref:DinB family protein n=1 Tax=Bacillus xiapuensis TaxID=2014075 RepID=A0ABU6NDA0_9BACI|nr:DinB family protein [Bacillus xiapuensis]
MNSVIENLLETRKYLIDEIKSLTHEEFNRKPGSDQWSVAEVCHHLVILETRTAMLIQHLVKQPDHKKVEPKPIHLATDRSKKFNAPESVQPSGEPFEIKQMLEMLTDARDGLMKVLESIEDQNVLMEISAAHPVFGELPLSQWVELIGLHEQRHIEQIEEIKQFVL